MARADLLKKLFRSYQQRDDSEFRAVARSIIEDERRKEHRVLAGELEAILRNGGRAQGPAWSPERAAQSMPMDSERKTPLLTIRAPDRYLDDLVLKPHMVAVIERTVEEFRGWDVLEAHGLTPTSRLLFCGPSGCGKTATAEALSAELSLPLLYVRFDSVVSSLLGETAANLRKVFDYAANGQWVVLFDEFDAIGRSRDDATEHGEIKRVVNSFLQLLDNFRGRSLVIGATNFEQALDPAIWRRFDEVVRFDLPTAEALASLIGKRLKPLRIPPAEVRSMAEVMSGASFAEGERVALDIRKAVALSGRQRASQRDMEQALERFGHRREVLMKATPTGPERTVDRG